MPRTQYVIITLCNDYTCQALGYVNITTCSVWVTAMLGCSHVGARELVTGMPTLYIHFN